jgi:dienelactone hydrolase
MIHRKGHAQHLCVFASSRLIGAIALALTLATSAAAKDDEVLDLLLRRPPTAPAKPAEKPVAKPMQTATIAGLTVAVWMPPDATKRPMPAIVFSHGFHGCNVQSSFLMRALAAQGYLVLAPNHRDSACTRLGIARGPQERFGRPSDWTDRTYDDRRKDLADLVDAIEKQVPWSSLVDPTRIGLAGHSLGGYTALGLAGGWETWKRADVKAVLALSPWCEPFVRRGALDRVEAAVMYQGGSIDLGITPSVRRPGGAYDKTPAPVYFVELGHAGHLAWTDLNPRFQDTIVHYALAFFDAHLKGAATAPLRERYGDAAEVRAK